MKSLISIPHRFPSAGHSLLRFGAVLGTILGGTLSSLYSAAITALIVLSDFAYLDGLDALLEATGPGILFDFVMGTLIGLLMGLLPSVLVGSLTGVLVALLFKVQRPTSRALRGFVGGAVAVPITVALHALAFLGVSSGDTIAERINSISLIEPLAYYILLGIPSIIFIVASALAGGIIDFQASDTAPVP